MKKKNMRRFSLLLASPVMILIAGCGNTQAITETLSSTEEPSGTSQAEMIVESESELDTDTDTDAENVTEESDVEENTEGTTEALQIQVESDGGIIVFELNDSLAAKSLYDQLPLTIEVQNYSSDEKIFYPPEALDTSDTPLANAVAGTLAYFEPWGDVVMYYDDFGSYSGLYELGSAVSGEENISSLNGSVTITQIEDID